MERTHFLGGVEDLDRANLDNLQLAALRRQVERVTHASPFYRERLEKAGIRVENIRTLDDLRAIPLVSKSELIADQESHPPFGTRMTVDSDQIARYEVTSGTSGLGQEIYGLTYSDMESVGSLAGWTMAMGGIHRGDRVAVMLPLGYLQGPWGGHWGGQSLGLSVLHLGLAPDTATKLRYLQQFRVNALYTPTPTFLMRLTSTAQEMGLNLKRDFHDLRFAWIVAETYPIEWVSRMEDMWGLRLHEAYGSTGGAFAASCEQGLAPGGNRGYLHNADWNVLLEVIDPVTGEPVGEMEYGEAVITTLRREASPLIRFRTGDKVRLMPHQGCPCGRRTVAIEAGTITRLDDMIKIKGMNVWPSAVDSVLLGCEAVLDYYAVVGIDDTGREYARLNVAFRDPITGDPRNRQLSDLQRKIQAITNVTMELHEVEPETLPRFEYKARRWQDRRSGDMLAGLKGASS